MEANDAAAAATDGRSLLPRLTIFPTAPFSRELQRHSSDGAAACASANATATTSATGAGGSPIHWHIPVGDAEELEAFKQNSTYGYNPPANGSHPKPPPPPSLAVTKLRGHNRPRGRMASGVGQSSAVHAKQLQAMGGSGGGSRKGGGGGGGGHRGSDSAGDTGVAGSAGGDIGGGAHKSEWLCVTLPRGSWTLDGDSAGFSSGAALLALLRDLELVEEEEEEEILAAAVAAHHNNEMALGGDRD